MFHVEHQPLFDLYSPRRPLSAGPSPLCVWPPGSAGSGWRQENASRTFAPVVHIRSQLADELGQQLAAWDEPSYRLNQVLNWLYSARVSRWDEMTNLPRRLREALAATFEIGFPEMIRKQGAADTTQKFLWQLKDGSLIESVLIPANPALYGESSDRHTLCVSTQVGCAYGCRFCASGLEGWKRNLGPEEIVDQWLGIERWHATAAGNAAGEYSPKSEASDGLGVLCESRVRDERTPPGTGDLSDRLVSNLVIMGMGEPLANYDNLLRALRILNAPWGGNIGARKITLSTSGLAPEIRRLADEPFQFRLAISLHGATDEVRNRIMPVNRKYPLQELTAACEYYRSRKGKMITFEYILIAGVNDSPEQAAPLARLARQLNAKVNLIPYNSVEGLSWERPSERAQKAFLSELEARHVPATLRLEKGHDIDAACGQLRLKTERERALVSGNIA